MVAPTDWVPILNTTSEVIPAGGLMSVVGVDATTGAFKVAKPSTDGDPTVCVNGFSLIPANGTGQGSFDPRAIVAYDPADGTPAVGDSWGAASGTWLAKKGSPGFTVLGGPGLGLVNAERAIPKPTVLVRCTSATPADGTTLGSQCYPAKVTQLGATATSFPDTTPVWLTVLDDGSPTVPSPDTEYLGIVAGPASVGGSGSGSRPRVFAAAFPGQSGTVPSCSAPDSWPAFLLATDCLTLTVESAFGRCSPFPAIPSPGYLVLQYDLASDSWLSTTSFTLPSGATAKAKFTRGDGDGGHLDLIVASGSGSGSGSGGSGGTFRMDRTCSGGGQAVFAGPTLDSGNAICAGTPIGGCGANGFYLRVKCAAVCTIPAPCCPTPGVLLPTRICVTFGTWDGGSGGASWYPALISGKTYVLTWNGGSWRYFDQIDDGASFELTFGCQATNIGYPDWALVAHFHGSSEGCGWDDYLYWRDSRNPQSPSVVASISTDIGFGDSGTNKSLTTSNACSPAVAVSGSVYGEWGASGCGAGGGQTWPSGTFVTFTVAGLDPITGTCTGGGGGGGGGGGPGTNCGFGFNSPSTMTLTVTGGPYAGSWTGNSFAGPPAYWDFNMTGASPKEVVVEFFGGAWHLVGTVGEDEVATGGQCSPSFGLTFAGSFIPGATAVSVSIP